MSRQLGVLGFCGTMLMPETVYQVKDCQGNEVELDLTWQGVEEWKEEGTQLWDIYDYEEDPGDQAFL